MEKYLCHVLIDNMKLVTEAHSNVDAGYLCINRWRPCLRKIQVRGRTCSPAIVFVVGNVVRSQKGIACTQRRVQPRSRVANVDRDRIVASLYVSGGN